MNGPLQIRQTQTGGMRVLSTHSNETRGFASLRAGATCDEEEEKEEAPAVEESITLPDAPSSDAERDRP